MISLDRLNIILLSGILSINLISNGGLSSYWFYEAGITVQGM